MSIFISLISLNRLIKPNFKPTDIVDTEFKKITAGVEDKGLGRLGVNGSKLYLYSTLTKF